MKRRSRLLAAIGLILVIVGSLGLAVAPQFKGFYVLPWGAAAICLVLYAYLEWVGIRKFLGSRSARYGAGSVLSVIFFAAILIFIALLTARHSVRWDLTQTGRYSLAPQTINVLTGLDREVKVTGYFQSAAQSRPDVRNLLDQYAHAGQRFSFEIVDPDRYPSRAQNAGVTRYDTVVVEAGGRSEKLADLTEETLTNAILRVTSGRKKAIYFLTGHGEKDLQSQDPKGYSQATGILTEQNYEVKPLLLMQMNQVPADAAVVVAAGTKSDLLENEAKALDQYLRSGGKCLFLVDPYEAESLVEFLAAFGVELGHDIVVDEMSRLAGGDYVMPLVTHYARHPVTDNFSLATFYPLARSVTPAAKESEGVKTSLLAQTGDKAWAETDLDTLAQGQTRFDQDADRPGPIGLAVVGEVKSAPAEKPEAGDDRPEPEPGRFIVFGDSDFASNQYFNLQGNGDLFLNAVSWLAEEGDLIAIRPKSDKSKPLMLTATQSKMVFWLPVAALPLAVLIVGILVLTSRRRKQ